MKVWVLGLTAALAALAAYLLLWPVPIDPARWTPPEAPALAGASAPNDALASVERLAVGFAPESVAVAPSGDVYAGLEDGSIIRWSDGAAETVVRIDGRPLGMGFDAVVDRLRRKGGRMPSG